MFTGIIKNVSRISEIKTKDGSLEIDILKPLNFKMAKGDSICVNGICSTVSGLFRRAFRVRYMPQTLRATTAAKWSMNRRVNLELPLTAGDFLSGHFVQGHVDGRGIVKKIQKEGSARILEISFPPELKKFLVSKGSVALDGVSLTIAGLGQNLFSVSLVDYTLAHTALCDLKAGDAVNIETDILGKYVLNSRKNGL